MSSQVWEWQLRFNLRKDFSDVARGRAGSPSIQPLLDVMAKHNATFKNQMDAFEDYCRYCEDNGLTFDPVYLWTKPVLSNPAKVAQYDTRFTVYADGGNAETYDAAIANAIEADLEPLLASGMLTKLNKFDTNPANNPQPPKQG